MKVLKELTLARWDDEYVMWRNSALARNRARLNLSNNTSILFLNAYRPASFVSDKGQTVGFIDSNTRLCMRYKKC